MDEKLDQAIEKMAEQAKASSNPQNVLHFSQAALNLAHAKAVLANSEGKPKNKGAGA